MAGSGEGLQLDGVPPPPDFAAIFEGYVNAADYRSGPATNSVSHLANARLEGTLSSMNSQVTPLYYQNHLAGAGNSGIAVGIGTLGMLHHHRLMIPGPGGPPWLAVTNLVAFSGSRELAAGGPILFQLRERSGRNPWMVTGIPGQIIWPHPDLSGLVRLPIGTLLDHERHQVVYSVGLSDYRDFGDIRDRLLCNPSAAHTDDSPWLGFTLASDILAREFADYALLNCTGGGGRSLLALELNLLGSPEWLATLHCRESRTFLDPRLLAAAENGDVFIVDATNPFWTTDMIIALVAMIRWQPTDVLVDAIGVNKNSGLSPGAPTGLLGGRPTAFYARGGTGNARAGFNMPHPYLPDSIWSDEVGQIHFILPTPAFNVAIAAAGGPVYSLVQDRLACPSGSYMRLPRNTTGDDRAPYSPGGVVLLRDVVRPKHRTAQAMRAVAARLSLDRNGAKPFCEGKAMAERISAQQDLPALDTGRGSTENHTGVRFRDTPPTHLPRPRSIHVIFSMLTQVRAFTGQPSYDPGLAVAPSVPDPAVPTASAASPRRTTQLAGFFSSRPVAAVPRVSAAARQPARQHDMPTNVAASGSGGAGEDYSGGEYDGMVELVSSDDSALDEDSSSD